MAHTDQLENDIAQTREELSETVDALIGKADQLKARARIPLLIAGGLAVGVVALVIWRRWSRSR